MKTEGSGVRVEGGKRLDRCSLLTVSATQQSGTTGLESGPFLGTIYCQRYPILAHGPRIVPQLTEPYPRLGLS